MLGGLGICGRPYCCSQFLDDFHPVSTKMAKVQSLSLNPAKISGSCGRLMCCLRYEQEAYEDLVKKVPKQGAFVETKDGYGTAIQVNILRSTVKVRLDEDREDVLHEYRSYELAAVPGGRPKDGAEPPHVLEYVEPESEEVPAEPADEWSLPTMVVTPVPETAAAADGGADENTSEAGRRNENTSEAGRRNRRSRSRHKGAKSAASEAPTIVVPVKEESIKSKPASERGRHSRGRKKPSHGDAQNSASGNAESTGTSAARTEKGSNPQAGSSEGLPKQEKKNKPRRRFYHGKKPSNKPASGT